jgi:non-specific serine/threonine protein kinase
MDKEKTQKNYDKLQVPLYNVLLWVNERAANNDEKALAYIKSWYKCEVLKDIIKWMFELAEKGDVDAQYNLGLHYKQTLDCNDKEAVKWFTKAANNGHIPSCWNLGMYYEYGLGDIDKDITKAIKWYTKVAESDEDSAYDAKLKLEKLLGSNGNN